MGAVEEEARALEAFAASRGGGGGGGGAAELLREAADVLARRTEATSAHLAGPPPAPQQSPLLSTSHLIQTLAFCPCMPGILSLPALLPSPSLSRTPCKDSAKRNSVNACDDVTR